MADFTWALAIGDSYSIGFNLVPLIQRGANFPSSLPQIFAPIKPRGETTLFIGLFRRYLSPLITEINSCPLSRPVKSRIVVPELPALIMFSGSVKPCRPLPCTVNSSLSVFLIVMPINLKALMVLKLSSPFKSPFIRVFPFANELIITAR